MKIRTDFVTNSSSSSFIYKTKSLPEGLGNIEAEIRKRGDAWDRKWMRDIKERAENVELKRIRDYGIWAIHEVACWYEDEILEECRDGGITKEVLKKLTGLGILTTFWIVEKLNTGIDTLSEEEITELLLRRWFWFLFDWVEEGTEEKGFQPEKALDELKRGRMTEEYRSMAEESQSLDRILLDHYSQMQELAHTYAGVPVGEILEELLEGRYMYFVGDSEYRMISEILSESPDCVRWCDHMG